jgi:hypothetical protein
MWDQLSLVSTGEKGTVKNETKGKGGRTLTNRI